jgi:adenosine deaminase
MEIGRAVRSRTPAVRGYAGRTRRRRRRWLDSVEAEARAILRCGTASASPSCGMSLPFLAQVLRGVSPSQVFAQSMLAFELASADSRVAGVKLVMPEDW